MIKFISYDGKYPNLCGGTLTLEIDGKKVVFPKNQSFWLTGGEWGFDKQWNEFTQQDKWQVNPDLIPEEYRKYAKEIEQVFNDNVPYGCCGGCI